MLRLAEGHDLLPRNKSKAVAEFMAWRIVKYLQEMC